MSWHGEPARTGYSLAATANVVEGCAWTWRGSDHSEVLCEANALHRG
jgi:hypothetical protein